MAKPMTIFRSSTGLNVKADPVRVRYDAQTGVTDLAACYNIDHDHTGRPSRRKGFEATAITSACHSLFCEGGDALCAIGSNLCLIAPDLSDYRSLATVTPGAGVSYAQVADQIFWVNGFEKGIVRAGVNQAWVKGQYYGPTSHRLLSNPPIGTIVRAHAGHMYIAQANVLWYSDPYNLNAFDLTRNYFAFESSIVMVEPVTSGIYVGTCAKVYFLAGTNPKNLQMVEKSIAPAIAGTQVKVDFSQIGFDELLQGSQGKGVMWTSPAGIYLGTAEGVAFNLTKYKLAKLDAVKGTAHVFNDKYVVCLAP